MSAKDLESLSLPKSLTKGLSIDQIFLIDETDLNREFSQQAAIHAYISQGVSKAEYELDAAKDKKELIWADCYEFYRDELEEEGKKITESLVRSRIIRDFTYGKAIESERKAQFDYNTLKRALRSIEQKGYMLTQYGAHQRSEMDMTGANITKKTDEMVIEAKANLTKMKQNR